MKFGVRGGDLLPLLAEMLMVWWFVVVWDNFAVARDAVGGVVGFGVVEVATEDGNGSGGDVVGGFTGVGGNVVGGLAGLLGVVVEVVEI